MSSQKPRIYNSADFHVPARMADDAAGILITAGALGCEVSRISRRIDTASGRNRAVLLRAYFDRTTPATLRLLQHKLQAAGMLANGSTPGHRVVVDPGWATMWQARFASLRIGQHFLIVPPWKREGEPGRITLVIQPGQGFGTGHHPSTASTLKVLEKLYRTHQAMHALDVGTGSGILAIAMAKMGVSQVTAVDIDQAALANAEENAKLNRVADRISFSMTPLPSLHGRFGLIAANILSSTLIRMAPDLTARLRGHGHLVLAGILRGEGESVVDAYVTRLGFVGRCDEGAWTTLIFQK